MSVLLSPVKVCSFLPFLCVRPLCSRSVQGNKMGDQKEARFGILSHFSLFSSSSSGDQREEKENKRRRRYISPLFPPPCLRLSRKKSKKKKLSYSRLICRPLRTFALFPPLIFFSSVPRSLVLCQNARPSGTNTRGLGQWVPPSSLRAKSLLMKRKEREKRANSEEDWTGEYIESERGEKWGSGTRAAVVTAWQTHKKDANKREENEGRKREIASTTKATGTERAFLSFSRKINLQTFSFSLVVDYPIQLATSGIYLI